MVFDPDPFFGPFLIGFLFRCCSLWTTVAELFRAILALICGHHLMMMMMMMIVVIVVIIIIIIIVVIIIIVIIIIALMNHTMFLKFII